jgi:hypothetical protein
MTRPFARALAAALVASLVPAVAAAPASAARVKTIRIADASIIEGNAGQQNLSFTISWTGSKGGQAPSVQYATADTGSATAGTDFTTTSGTANLTNGGCKCATINVPVEGDTTTEGTETFAVNLSNAVNGTIDDGQATGTIYDNEGAPALVVGDVSANESAGTLGFTVQLTNASASTVTVDYATADGTATEGDDYTSASGSLSFTAGQTSKPVAVTVATDGLAEDDETVSLDLTNAVNATIADAQGLGSIVNDDADPTAAIDDVSAGEAGGVATFTVTLDTASGRETAVDYSTAGATATAGADYEDAAGTLTIPAGETSATFDVTIDDDDVFEGDETFGVTLSGEVDLTLANTTATGTVTDDDPVPTLTAGASSVSEGDGTATITFSLTNPSVGDVTFDWASADGTATDGADYTAGGGTAVIASGETATTADLTVLADTTDESDETVTVTLANVTGATDGGPGTLTITDDDPSPTALTAKVAKTKTAIKVKGVLEPATTGLQIKVVIQRKQGTRYVKVAAKTVTVKALGDRDGDTKPDVAYVASFPKPSNGRYRAKVSFAPTPELLKSAKTVGFKI